MNRPPVEVADIVRASGDRFLDHNGHWLHWSHVKALNAIRRCRTAALGGHRDRCTKCGHEEAFSYNSCRNRHCPKCQTAARNRWVAERQTEVLPVGYFHVVFTLPHEFSALALQNKKPIYGLLFRACAATLLEVAANPQNLGAEIGFLSILHTWGQNLLHHPHLHCLVPGGGISPDRARWIHSSPKFLLPIPVLREVFRAKFLDGLMRLFRAGKLVLSGKLQPLREEKAFRAFLDPLSKKEWVVYAKAPFGGPEHLLQYLARYTHRVAISNHRLVSFDGESVTFRWKDYAQGNKARLMTVSAEEFLRRFLLHILPRGFVRIRSFGFLAGPRRAAMLELARQLLPTPGTAVIIPASITTHSSFLCPVCGAPMAVVERFSAAMLRRTGVHRDGPHDSS
jgi:putative transposase/transposase-like zinc-binding protein